TSEQIHDDAERFEHLLTEEILDEVDQQLGYPRVDPHGSPIPGKHAGMGAALAGLAINDEALISAQQPNNQVTAALWQMNLEPRAKIRLLDKDASYLTIQVNGNTLSITVELARTIHIEPVVHSSSDPI
ncbi:MAG: iron dependent repressor, metal binding and dimerization domain protein, partial [Saprospiraceae bacterium]|nr:iron dependent repressor, metal binding and dimerization domain protein [Saprospiraceae bacterium]